MTNHESGNRVIAEFDGLEYITEGHVPHWDRNGIPEINLQYHTSWDWIMPVVEKIEKIKGVHCVISELGCDIYHFGKHISNTREATKIETVYKAVIQFINWYNTQKTITHA